MTADVLNEMLQRKDITDNVRNVVSEWMRERQRMESLQRRLKEFNLRLDESPREQKRINSLMPTLTRGDSLHTRYLSKLASIEDEIDKIIIAVSKTRMEMQVAK